MIDIHSHIIPRMVNDDGVGNYYDATLILESASKRGLQAIVATPHLKGEIPDDFSQTVRQKVDSLKSQLVEKGIDVTVYPGVELFMSEKLFERIDDPGLTLNHTGKYVLIEFPMTYKPPFADELLDAYLSHGILPIIAHPERYLFMMDNPNYLYELVDKGMLAQINADSILGGFGLAVKNLATKFLEHDLIHFVSSDVHSPEWRPWNLDRAYKELVQLTGKKEAQDLTAENARIILNGDDLPTYEPIPIDFSIGFSVKQFIFNIYEGLAR